MPENKEISRNRRKNQLSSELYALLNGLQNKGGAMKNFGKPLNYFNLIKKMDNKQQKKR